MKRLFIAICVLFYAAYTSCSVHADTQGGNTSSQATQTKQSIDKSSSSFKNDLFSGIAAYSYDFTFPEWQRGITPRLGLSYNSATTDTLSDAGYGFSLGVSSIFRATRKGNDKLYALNEFAVNADFGSNELVETSSGVYMGKNNNDLAQYSFSGETWTVRDNQWNTYVFGGVDTYRQINPGNNKTFRWLLQERRDNFGHKITYEYQKKDNNVYLSKISYGFSGNTPLYTIQINYLERSFSALSYIYGFKLENHRLVSSVVGSVCDTQPCREIKKYTLNYSEIETAFPKLVSISESAGGLTKPDSSFEYYKDGIGVNLLKTIRNGRGGDIWLEYKSSTAYKGTTVPFVIKTLYKVTYTDAVTWLKSAKTYDYVGGNFYFDPTNIFQRGYTGFSKVRIIDDNGAYIEDSFHQSESDSKNSENAALGEFEDHISKKGRIYREESFDANGKLYTSRITKWNKVARGNGAYFVFSDQNTNILWNGTGSHIDTAEAYTYDMYANLVKRTIYGLVNANTGNGSFSDIPGDTTSDNAVYAIDTSGIFIANPCRKYSVDTDEKIFNDARYTYDALPDCQIKSWLLTKKSWYFVEESRSIGESYKYSTGWLLIEKSDALWNPEKYTYDSFDLFPVSTLNAKGFTTTASYDYAIQAPLIITDPNNIRTKNVYDAFGRVLEQRLIRSDNSEVLIAKTKVVENTSPNYIEQTSMFDGTAWRVSRFYFDGFWKNIETKTSSKDTGVYSVTKLRYDTLWNVVFSTYEKFEPSPDYTPIAANELGNTFTYDALNRLTSQVNKDWEMKFSYSWLKTTAVNQLGIPKSYTKDVFGNLVQVEEYSSGSLAVTKYEYTQRNRLSRMLDAKNSTRSIAYDSLGRLTKMEDLRASTATWTNYVSIAYNDNSQVSSRTMLSGDKITYLYDSIGRLTQENIAGKIVTYEYDTAVYGKWQLSKFTKDGYSEAYAYDEFWRKAQEQKIYPEKTYTNTYSYSVDGNIVSLTYDDGKKANYAYQNGYLNALTYAGTPVLNNIVYADNNTPKRYEYANGVVTEDTLDYTHGYRIIGRKATTASGTLQNLEYKFDLLGNSTNINDSANTVLKKQSSFMYDDIGRLITASITGADNVNLIQNYSYDAVGNIISQSGVGNYTYNGTNPHAVTNVGGTPLLYDTNGNVASEGSGPTAKTYVYSPKQELLSTFGASGDTKYLYDAFSTRVRKDTKLGNSQTITNYVWDAYEDQTTKLFNASWAVVSTKTLRTKYLFAGNGKIASVLSVDGGVENITYHLSDHLWGASIDISQTGAVLQYSDYLPYGANRILSRTQNYKNNYLFTGKEKDEESDLQYFEARYYSPTNGRFYSQDRVFWEIGQTKRGVNTLSDPQSLNAYSYARNNPIVYSDPTGEFVDTVLDAATFSWDAGGILTWASEYTWEWLAKKFGESTNNQKLINSAEQWMSASVQKMQSKSLDVAIDGAALVVPGLSAPTAKWWVSLIKNEIKKETKNEIKKEAKSAAQKALEKKLTSQIYNGQVEGKVIIPAEKIGDPKFRWWEKRAYYYNDGNGNKVDMHWMQNPANWAREQITPK